MKKKLLAAVALLAFSASNALSIVVPDNPTEA